VTQLNDDCFAFDNKLTLFSDALAEIDKRLRTVVGKERVSLNQAINRVLAEEVVSPRNVPPHNNSAVDGYAVRYKDLNKTKNTRLRVAGRVAAGDVPINTVKPKEAFRIFTGAPVPKSLDTIFMQEDCKLDGNHIALPPGIKRYANYRFAGEDLTKNSTVASTGTLLRPQEIGLAASIGRRKLEVFRPLKVAIFSTGKEICDPYQEISDSSVFDANRFSIYGLLQNLGATVTDMGILPDNQKTICASLGQAAKKNDLLITSGGVSTGEEDHVKKAVESIGDINFWRLAIKPGRPITLGQVNKSAFIGLPGNPVAAMVTFMLIARPIILKMSGRASEAPPRPKIIADFDYKKKLGRREWVRVRLSQEENMPIIGLKPVGSGAGILTSMVNADGLVELTENSTGITRGDTVNFLSFEDIFR